MSQSSVPSKQIQVADIEQIAGFQQWMLNALIQPGAVNPDEVGRRFTAGANLQAVDCLAIYQRGYMLRLAKCLAEQFPALCHALGASLFDQFARQYLTVCPSDSYTLYELGRRFPDYLDEVRPDRDLPPTQREGWVDFIVDLARYEWLHFKLFDAPGHEGNPWPSIDVPEHRLVIQPCFELGIYRYPVAWYYHAVKEQPEVAFPPQQPCYVAVLRKDYHVTTYPINRIHYLFLQQLQSSRDIASALDYVSEVAKTPLEQVTHSWRNEVRSRWIHAGFFIECDAG